MTLIEAIEEVAEEIELPVFYCELGEANYGLDNVKTYPTILVIPFVVKDKVGTSGLIQSSAQVEMFFLDKIVEQETIEHVKRDTEALVERMRTKARMFFKLLRQHSITDQTVEYEDVDHTPTYDSLDSHSHGVVSTTTLHFVESLTCDGTEQTE